MSSTTSLPTTNDQWVFTSRDSPLDGNFSTLKLKKNVPFNPTLRPNDVLVRIHAVSLNFRDLFVPSSVFLEQNAATEEDKLHVEAFTQRMKLKDGPLVPCSDGAGEVLAVGPDVTRFKVGDKVVTLLDQLHQYGPPSKQTFASGLGGSVDGTLRKYAVFSEQGLVRMPRNLSWEEAGTLTCAGVTAWNALYGLKALQPGQYVLVQGTGGVSTFALKFAKAAGATVVATTSTDEKAQILKDLGADHVINYKTNPTWGLQARSLTPDDIGFDHVLDVGGPATLKQSIQATAYDGIVSLIGMMGGYSHPDAPPVLEALSRVVVLRGVYAGSRQQMEDMCRAIEGSGVRPVVNSEVFGMERAKEAFKHQFGQKHVGNVVIRIE